MAQAVAGEIHTEILWIRTNLLQFPTYSALKWILQGTLRISVKATNYIESTNPLQMKVHLLCI